MSVALVLPEDAVSGASPVTFPGFPGVWTPGQAVEAQAFVDEGIFADVDGMLAAVDELGLPLERTDVKKGKAPLPERDNHIAAGAPAEEPAEEPAADEAPAAEEPA